ncbi:hypothetical protein V491_00709 [Pseudogymnoascus sp. VKM F-3775]|nr:hypothetical protein V491_00709 [Pseudogymnoascus sp. VKM F-3775]
MTSLSQLETYSNELATAVKALADHSRDACAGATPHLTVAPGAPCEVHRARRNILTIVARVKALLAEPADFIQHLACQNQLLACLQWLGEFQVLACIPLSGSIPAKDVADVVGVPEMQLCRIVRMTATAGFLYEPQSGHIAHTALSAPFVTKLSYLDAIMFLAETAAPAALQMAAATQHHRHSDRPFETAYNLAFNTSQTFQSACKQRMKLQRQWSAYSRCSGDLDDSVTEFLSRLDWPSLGNACIVDVGAHSTAAAMALSELYPALHFIVQMSEPASTNGTVSLRKEEELSRRITVQKRTLGAPQMVKNAAVYILHLPLLSLGESSVLSARIVAELRPHLSVLRANTSATLVLAPRLLPQPETVDPDVEAMARLHDLSRLQLTNERDMEMEELEEIVNSIHDSMGRLNVAIKLRSRNSASVALAVKYQAYADMHHEAEPTVI